MGIRVHKLLGYGLTDVQVGEDGEIADERIDPASILLNYNTLEEFDGNLTDAYFEYSQARGGRLGRRALGEELPDDEPFNCVTHQSEYGLSNVLLIQPVEARGWGWRRFDDILDYVEESRNHDQADRVEVLDTSIYPFTGYMRADTGERIKSDIFIWVRACNAEKPAEPAEVSALLDEFAQLGGFADHEEATRLVVPLVPPEVRTLVEFGELFTSPDTWHLLRPMIYVYWA